jgi:hypothetical protein
LRAFANYLHVVFTSFLQFASDSHRSCSIKQQRRTKRFAPPKNMNARSQQRIFKIKTRSAGLARGDFPAACCSTSTALATRDPKIRVDSDFCLSQVCPAPPQCGA